MDISITIFERGDVLDEIIKVVNEKLGRSDVDWKLDMYGIKTSIDISEKLIVSVFEFLITNYLDIVRGVYASYHYSVRDDDSSADWWGTTKITDEVQDGIRRIVTSDATYWN